MTSSAPPPELARVAVFAKAPIPGTVKTRLAGVLGDEGAARLHAALVRRALATALASALGEVELWCAPDDRHEFFVRCARQTGARLRVQSGADLGERMQGAFRAAAEEGRRLVLIGSDCPGLGAGDLRAAAEAVRSHDAAIVPAEDGGYVLIALARPVAGLFAGIDWGSAAVMEQTRARLAAAGASLKELPTRWDVDRPEDYARLRREAWIAGVDA